MKYGIEDKKCGQPNCPLVKFGNAGLFVINQPSHPTNPPPTSLITTPSRRASGHFCLIDDKHIRVMPSHHGDLLSLIKAGGVAVSFLSAVKSPW
ncbi:hypothetical protein [Pseudomonas sp. URMO17WK12:I11]|uniref:hypothetical protein n=1 Tax=Pseudomonas sp. URMO17WK12:I11 TaxID=1283291 RepID=UPI0011A7511E|nr:hypothetical protein [Pseudomonas sp. URMO17WK12:I11]